MATSREDKRTVGEGARYLSHGCRRWGDRQAGGITRVVRVRRTDRDGMGATTETEERRAAPRIQGTNGLRRRDRVPPENDRLGSRVRPRLRPGGRCAAAKSPRRSIIPLRRNAEVDPGASLSAQHRAVVEAAAEGRGIPGADACANRPASSIAAAAAAAHTAAGHDIVASPSGGAPPTARRRRVHAPWRRLPSPPPPQTQKEEKEEEVRPGPSRLRRRARRLHHCARRRAQPKKKG